MYPPVRQLRPYRPLATPSVEKATLLYVTDPLCSGCWLFEPAWRRLRFHYEDLLTVRTIYGGLLRAWDGFRDPRVAIAGPADVASHWRRVAARTGQPMGADVWHTDPPSSSYPASKAAHVVRMLDPSAEERFLRRIRESVFLEARNIARHEVLIGCAADVGVDIGAFCALFDADAGTDRFAADLRERRALGVTRFPTLLLAAQGAEQPRGIAIGAQLEDVLMTALRRTRRPQAPTVDVALEAYRSGTTSEFAALLELPPREAEAQLERAGATRRALGSGAYWTT